MAKMPYETASSEVEVVDDVVLASGDNAYLDPWGVIEKLEL